MKIFWYIAGYKERPVAHAAASAHSTQEGLQIRQHRGTSRVSGCTAGGSGGLPCRAGRAGGPRVEGQGARRP